MSRRVPFVTAGVAALVLAIPLALLGRAVLATPETTERVSANWPANARVDRGRSLAERAAAHLLAANRVEGFLEIADTYRRVTDIPALAGAAVNPLTLARMIPKLHSGEQRAQAHLMVGAIFALPAGNGSVSFDLVRQAGQGRLLDQAKEEFRAATLLDDGNEDAKYDLELILKREAQLQRNSRLAPSKKGEKSGKRKKIEQNRSGRRSRDRVNRTDIRQRSAGFYAGGSGY